MPKKQPKDTPHGSDKKLNKAGKRTKGQDRAAARGGKDADKDVDNAIKKFWKGL